ncbi:hypothetical protein [Vibrio jasicida]|uniref:hypothetical protein n=1 Tax=Vibrio jasicida TaxID=766224 RepID=UPI001D0F8B0A|nr:hypothetical protein [Vibrio jasicida]
MKKSTMQRLLENWGSGRFSIWKSSIVIGLLIVTNPWIYLWGETFSIDSHLNNPNRSLQVYINHGLFTFISQLDDGTTRKSSGLVGYTNNKFYFLTLNSKYLYIHDHTSRDFWRDLINVNNHYFYAEVEHVEKNKFLLSYKEEIESEGYQTQTAWLSGDIEWLKHQP